MNVTIADIERAAQFLTLAVGGVLLLQLLLDIGAHVFSMDMQLRRLNERLEALYESGNPA